MKIIEYHDEIINTETGEGERLSDIHPAHFQRYFDRWIRFWPKSPYIVKRGYTTPWYHQQTRKKNRHQSLYPDLARELTERHLDSYQWAEWKEAQDGRARREEDFWLGLMMPRKTSVSNIDIDAKEFQFGTYRVRQYHKVKQDNPVRPIVYLPVEHLKKVKRIYDHFPGRIWCVSSLTLGLHAWLVYDRPKSSVMVHSATKEELQSIGLGQIEVHPMPGRGQRRPFGRHYLTITPNGVLTTWREQSDFFENEQATPSFDQIVRVLLNIMKDQWNWSAKNGGPDLAPYLHQLVEAEDWLAAGCPLELQNTSSSTGLLTCLGTLEADKPKLNHKKGTQVFDLDNLRHGNWPKELARLATEGLDAPKSLQVVCFEMAKYLYWYELYDMPEEERKVEIVQLLRHFVKTKHNGMSSRVTDGRWDELERDIGQAVNLADKVDNAESLEVFCRMRLKRDSGLYKEVICLRPLILGQEKDSTHSFIGLLTCLGTLEALPPELSRKIQDHAGRCKVMDFASKLVNVLWNNKGSAQLGGDKLCELLGYKDPKKTSKYVGILIDAGVLRKGKGYSVGRFPKRYTLTKGTMDILEGAWVKVTQDTAG